MGITTTKKQEEDYQKEYFRIVKKDLSESMKKIKSTLHTNTDNDIHWVKYLLDKFSEYLPKNRITFTSIDLVIYYLKNITESSEVKHIYNLTLFLTKEIDINSFNKSFISYDEINKDDLLWKSSIYILEDIEDITHPINMFIEHLRFNLSFVYEREYYKYINDCISVTEILYTSIIDELNIFTGFLTEALIIFYDVRDVLSTKIYDIFREKLKDLLVRKYLYNFLYKIKSKLNETNKHLFAERLIKYYNIRPQHLAISPYFAQDNKFKEIILNKLDKQLITCESIPFSNSILMLRKITEYDSILKKIDLMYRLRNSLLEEIDSYWKEIKLKSKYKSVDANNFIGLFIYIIIKSQIQDIYIDIVLIDNFITKNLKLSGKGYFFSLIQSSSDYLISILSDEQLDSNINEYNTYFNTEMEKFNKEPFSILENI